MSNNGDGVFNALHRLEFYKKQKRWKFSHDVEKESGPAEQSLNHAVLECEDKITSYSTEGTKSCPITSLAPKTRERTTKTTSQHPITSSKKKRFEDHTPSRGNWSNPRNYLKAARKITFETSSDYKKSSTGEDKVSKKGNELTKEENRRKEVSNPNEEILSHFWSMRKHSNEPSSLKVESKSPVSKRLEQLMTFARLELKADTHAQAHASFEATATASPNPWTPGDQMYLQSSRNIPEPKDLKLPNWHGLCAGGEEVAGVVSLYSGRCAEAHASSEAAATASPVQWAPGEQMDLQSSKNIPEPQDPKLPNWHGLCAGGEEVVSVVSMYSGRRAETHASSEAAATASPVQWAPGDQMDLQSSRNIPEPQDPKLPNWHKLCAGGEEVVGVVSMYSGRHAEAHAISEAAATASPVQWAPGDQMDLQSSRNIPEPQGPKLPNWHGLCAGGEEVVSVVSMYSGRRAETHASSEAAATASPVQWAPGDQMDLQSSRNIPEPQDPKLPNWHELCAGGEEVVGVVSMYSGRRAEAHASSEAAATASPVQWAPGDQMDLQSSRNIPEPQDSKLPNWHEQCAGGEEVVGVVSMYSDRRAEAHASSEAAATASPVQWAPGNQMDLQSSKKIQEPQDPKLPNWHGLCARDEEVVGVVSMCSCRRAEAHASSEAAATASPIQWAPGDQMDLQSSRNSPEPQDLEAQTDPGVEDDEDWSSLYDLWNDFTLLMCDIVNRNDSPNNWQNVVAMSRDDPVHLEAEDAEAMISRDDPVRLGAEGGVDDFSSFVIGARYAPHSTEETLSSESVSIPSLHQSNSSEECNERLGSP